MTHAELAATLLRDAAKLFRAVGGKGPESAERVEIFASMYETVAALVEKDPQGVFDVPNRD